MILQEMFYLQMIFLKCNFSVKLLNRFFFYRFFHLILMENKVVGIVQGSGSQTGGRDPF